MEPVVGSVTGSVVGSEEEVVSGSEGEVVSGSEEEVSSGSGEVTSGVVTDVVGSFSLVMEVNQTHTINALTSKTKQKIIASKFVFFINSHFLVSVLQHLCYFVLRLSAFFEGQHLSHLVLSFIV